MPEKHHILLITVDQERFPLNFPDNVKVRLPSHKILTRRGITFNNFQIGTAPCTPSRSVIYTGQHTPRTEMYDIESFPWQGDLDPSIPTIGHMLRDAGYYTAYKGKWHLSTLPQARADKDCCDGCFETDEDGNWIDENGNVQNRLREEECVDAQGDPIDPSEFGPRVPAASARDALEPYGFADHNPCGHTFGNALDGFNNDADIAEDAVAWLKAHNSDDPSDSPWFLAVNFVNPHDTMYFDSDDEGVDLGEDGYVENLVLDPPESAIDWEPAPDVAPYAPQPDHEDLPELPASFYPERNFGFKDFEEDYLGTKPATHTEFYHGANFSYGGNMPRPEDEEDEENHEYRWRNRLNYYINCIRDVDHHIGRVLSKVKWHKTIVVFTSDHGEMAGAHGLRQKGPFVYKENVNVPFIVCHPEHGHGEATDALTSFLDLAPTLLSFAGLDEECRKQIFPQLEGCDFSPALADPTNEAGRAGENGKGALFTYDALATVDMEWIIAMTKLGFVIDDSLDLDEVMNDVKNNPRFDIRKRGFIRAVVDDRYKFARYYQPIRANRGRCEKIGELKDVNDLELYDMANDPDEVYNLASSTVRSMLATMAAGEQNIPEALLLDEDEVDTILTTMNEKLNQLVDTEIGATVDTGARLPFFTSFKMAD